MPAGTSVLLIPLAELLPERAPPMTASTATTFDAKPPESDRHRKRRLLHEERKLNGKQGIAGWLFVSPALLGLLIFLVIPIVVALYISFTNWNGASNPLSGSAKWIGLDNYRKLLTTDSLTRTNFFRSVRNNFYFVLFVVPAQTILALLLAVLVHQKALKARSFYRTAFYFPSVTSSIAITLVFIFLFQGTGAVNKLLDVVGVKGPNWLQDQRGLFHQLLRIVGVDSSPGWGKHTIMGLHVWDWLAGPSTSMCVIIILAVWTTSGTFMLMFLAALQNIPEDVMEASMIDGASPRQGFWKVTVPMLRPTISLVVMLGTIGTWQVFDQILLAGKTNPTMSTPAYLTYQLSFQNSAFGTGAAMAFLLFMLIIVLTVIQRRFLKENV